MNYRVKIPPEARQEIGTWGLAREQIVALFLEIHDIPNRLDSMWRLAAPMPTWVVKIDMPVAGSPIQRHNMTFYLTETEEEGVLLVVQCDHDIDDDLGEEETQ